MKELKKLFTLLMISLFGMVLAACGDKSNGSNPIFATNVGDGGAYYEEDDENVTSISIFKNDWAEFNTARTSNSPIYEVISNKIDCDIIGMNSSSSTWETQLGMMQADEDLPDIFITNGPENASAFSNFIENGDLLPISDWVSEEHYPNIYNYLKQFEFLRSNVSYAYGKHWFIPSTWHLEKSLYIRIDWIENLNAKLDSILVKEGIVKNTSEITDEIRETWKFKVPETLLDFYRLARAFTKYDPDNNGLDDTQGYISESNKDMDGWIYVAFDAGWDQFIKEDGMYIPNDIATNSMYATQFVTRLIAEGYMSIDSLTNDNGGKQNKFMNGKAGMMYAHNWYNVIVSGIMDVNKCSLEEVRKMVAIVEPPMGKNGTHGGPGDSGWWQGFCINANMSNARIRKCLELYDYLLSEEGYHLLQYGVEGVHYRDNGDGTMTNLLPTEENGFIKSIQSVDTAAMLYALVDWTMHYNNTIQTNADIIAPRQAESERNSSFSDYPNITGENFIYYYEGAHKSFLENITILQKNERNMYYTPQDDTAYNPTTFTWDDLYNVSKVFSNKWKTFVKEYKENRSGNDIIQEYNDYIASGNAKLVKPSDYIFNSKLKED